MEEKNRGRERRRIGEEGREGKREEKEIKSNTVMMGSGGKLGR